jgi:hypothetical protein
MWFCKIDLQRHIDGDRPVHVEEGLANTQQHEGDQQVVLQRLAAAIRISQSPA